MGRGKQVTLHFKRCGLKKYGKMIRGKQVTLYFKRCYLKKYRKMIRGKQITLHFKCCILNVAVWKNTGKWNILISHPRGKQVTLHFKCCSLEKYGKMIRGKQITLHFNRCISNVTVWKSMGKWYVENK